MESKRFKKLGQIFFGIFFVFYSAYAIALPHYSSIVIEYPSKKVLFSESPDTPNPPASLAKVMTLYLVFESLNAGKLSLRDTLLVSQKAANRQPSRLGLRPNQTLTVEEAIQGLVTKSANDAASVIAENMAGTEDNFAQLMNAKAKALGMNNTVFHNASGIPEPNQTTTANDMVTLGTSILRDFPHFYNYFSLRQFDFRGRIQRNHNHLLGKYFGCDGIKTGYTVASGFNLIASATRNGNRVVAVILGGKTAKSRDNRMMQLMDIGFSKLNGKSTPELPEPTKSLPVPNLKTSEKETGFVF